MKRVRLLPLCALWTLACTVPSYAQQPEVPTIGVLSTGSPGSRGSDQFLAFQLGLSEAGYVENQSVKIEYRWASDDYSKLPGLAEELVRLNVAVIVAAGGSVSAVTVHKATKDIPIVFTTVTDPVRSGLVASFNKPGGNATGTAGLTQELDAKRLELLHELIPTATTIGVLINPKRPNAEQQMREVVQAADKIEVKLDVRKAATEREIDIAFEGFASQKVAALIVTADPFFNNRRSQVVALAASTRIPAIYQWRQFVSAGGLISYGPSITEAYRHAGATAGKILKGEKPADIPVVQPAKFDLAINLRTARKLGLTIPTTLLVQADDVID